MFRAYLETNCHMFALYLCDLNHINAIEFYALTLKIKVIIPKNNLGKSFCIGLFIKNILFIVNLFL